MTSIPAVHELHLVLTSACNLRCTYCYLNHGQRTHSQLFMDKSTLDQIFCLFFDKKSIPVSPSVDILLTGGEPTLNADLIRYTAQKVSKEGFISLRLITNAYNLDKVFPILNEFYFHDITVSLDGPKEVHDAHRRTAEGGGTFDAVQKNVESLLQLHKKGKVGRIVAQITATERSYPLVYSVAYLDSRGLHAFIIEHAYHFSDSPQLFSNEYMTLVRAVLHSLLSDSPLYESGTISCLYRILVRKEPGGCGAGSHLLAVAPDGAIYPCATLEGIPNFLMGNVHDFNLKEYTAACKKLADITASKHSHLQCGKCLISRACSHWCFAVNFLERGSPTEYPDGYCDMRSQMVNACVSFLEQLTHEERETLKKHMKTALRGGL